MKKAFDNIATVFGLGYKPFAPGTWGSAAGLILVLFLHGSTALYLATFIVLFIVGVKSSSQMVAKTGISDPPFVVIDEFACIFLVYLFVPIRLSTIIAGFIIYRILDIKKPAPIKDLEKIRGGWGIMLDDFAAGIYANLILQVLLFLGII